MTPMPSPRLRKSAVPFYSRIKSNEKETSTSAEERAPYAIKTLLETGLTDTLVSVMSKQIPCIVVETPKTPVTKHRTDRNNQLNSPTSCNIHETTDNSSNGVLASVLKRMVEIENKNRALKE